MIRQLGHSILCNPNLGTLTRKPKPRADKQALGHIQPQTEAKQGESTDSQQSQAAILASSLIETAGSRCKAQGARIQRRQHTGQDHQAISPVYGPTDSVGAEDRNRLKSKVLVGTGVHTCKEGHLQPY